MFKDLRIIIINHLGMIILTICIIIAIYFIYTQVIREKGESVIDDAIVISDVIGSNTSSVYNNKVLSGTQVLSAIKKYYDNSDIIILLFNDSKNYNNTSCRFWVTGKGGKFGLNTNYESNIFTDYNNITSLLIQDKSINSNYNKDPLESYTNSTSKNYIRLDSKYKSVLLKCNDYTVGIAFFAI